MRIVGASAVLGVQGEKVSLRKVAAEALLVFMRPLSPCRWKCQICEELNGQTGKELASLVFEKPKAQGM